MSSKENPFWVVWNPGHGLPRMMHSAYADALREAKRLATLTPGEDFIVMQAISKTRTTEPVEITEYDDVPF